MITDKVETSIPGIMVNTSVTANTPQSTPDAPMVRIMGLANGFSSIDESALKSSRSTPQNMKLKNTVTPMPELINGKKIRIKKRGRLLSSIKAVLSISLGTEDINPSKTHTANGTLNKQWASATAMWVSNPTDEYNWKKVGKNTAGGATSKVMMEFSTT